MKDQDLDLVVRKQDHTFSAASKDLVLPHGIIQVDYDCDFHT
jgi:hypothetical protein